MKSRGAVQLGMGVLLLFVLAVLALSLMKPPVPVALIRVVDASGRPIEGATITPDGLRPKKGGGHYWWGGGFDRSGLKAVTVRTDADGFARVVYPFYVDEKLETGEISFGVDHPEFCADRPFRLVAPSPPANAPLQEKLRYLGRRLLRRVQSRPEPVVLKRGGVVKVTGYVGEKENVVTNLFAEVSNFWPAGTNFWRRSGQSLWSRKVSAGTNALRAVHFPAEGRTQFSHVVPFAANAGETNEFFLELKPGLRVAGRLDESVPRPVMHGRVCVEVFSSPSGSSNPTLAWNGWRPLSPDGTFVFDSLPAGRLEIIGLCDGFVSQNGPAPRGGGTSQRLPQVFTVDGQDLEVVLKMEPAATCEITVLDDAGRPLAGATAGFWPNVLWGGHGSTIFADNLFNSEDYFHGAAPDWAAIQDKTKEDFHAKSDERGVAMVRNLPAGNQDYSVWHTHYDFPINRADGSASRSASMSLSPGETGRVTVTMQKKGTEELTH